MARYKVLQDIEAEDHILGPLTLRQFIFGLVTAFLLYMCFICITKGAPFLLVILLPPALFTGFFAFPFGRDQPTEIWALAKIRFLFKPRRRIWDQSGVKELVTVTVPKKVERALTNGLSETEVKSRLNALANTIDSRGWAVKNVNVNMYNQPNPMMVQSSDRLIDIDSMPQQVPNYDVQAADDMLDEVNNPIAQQFESMIASSTQTHRQHIVDELNNIQVGSGAPAPQPSAAPADSWFTGQPAVSSGASQALPVSPLSPPFSSPAPVQNNTSPTTVDEAAFLQDLKARNSSQDQSYAHLRTIQPLGSQPQPAPAAQSDDTPAAQPSPASPDPAILSLANNNDLNVATLAREAQKATHPDTSGDGEVVISLH